MDLTWDEATELPAWQKVVTSGVAVLLDVVLKLSEACRRTEI